MEKYPAKPRPGGRTAKNTQATAEAVLAELEQGNVDFTASDIARRTGLNKSTIYRRWPQKADLLKEGMKLHTSRVQVPDTGDWQTDLRKLIHELADFAADPVEMAINQALIDQSSQTQELASVASWSAIFQWLAIPIKNAQQRGEISKTFDPQTLLQVMFSPLLLSSLLTRKRIDKDTLSEMLNLFTLLTKE